LGERALADVSAPGDSFGALAFEAVEKGSHVFFRQLGGRRAQRGGVGVQTPLDRGSIR